MRTLQLTHSKDKKSTYDITDDDAKHPLLYQVVTSSKKPHLTITGFDAANAEQFPVGTVVFHTLTNSIETTVTSGSLNLSVTNKKSGSMKVESSSADSISGDLVRDGATANFKLVVDGSTVAQFKAGSLYSDSVGQLHVPETMDPHELDSLIVSFATCIEKQRSITESSAAVVGGRPEMNTLWGPGSAFS